MKKKIWLKDSKAYDYIAAADYLDLLFPVRATKKMIIHLKNTATINKKAKGILRAGELPLLTKAYSHIKENLRKVKKGEKLSPVLFAKNNKLIIADRYHRICSIYYLAEDLQVPCRIAEQNSTP